MRQYARASRFVDDSCEDEVISLLANLRARGPAFPLNGEKTFFAEQNALVVREAERYYRTMVAGGPESWNIRDQYMTQTLERLTRHYGPQARAIVWEHNTHIGDARYTDMVTSGMVNVGQLVRENHDPEDVVLIGFGTHRGTVIAAAEWEAPMERMRVPPARPGSWEDVLHRAVGGDALFLFELVPAPPRRVTEEMLEWRGHRAIGVVYDPDLESFGNYVPTVLPRRYDAFLFLDETRALRPLHVPALDDAEPPQTFPFRE